jgi:hypothetical protein
MISPLVRVFLVPSGGVIGLNARGSRHSHPDVTIGVSGHGSGQAICQTHILLRLADFYAGNS